MSITNGYFPVTFLVEYQTLLTMQVEKPIDVSPPDDTFIKILSPIKTVQVHPRTGNKHTTWKFTIVPVFEGIVTGGKGSYVNRIYEYKETNANTGAVMQLRAYQLSSSYKHKPSNEGTVNWRQFRRVIENGLSNHNVHIVAYDKYNNPIDISFMHITTLRTYVVKKTVEQLDKAARVLEYDELAPKDVQKPYAVVAALPPKPVDVFPRLPTPEEEADESGENGEEPGEENGEEPDNFLIPESPTDEDEDEEE